MRINMERGSPPSGTATPSKRRRLHLGHFAFMRAVVQGIDAQASWNRYLRIEGDYADIRNVRRTMTWIRDEFAAAARRDHRFGTARLVLINAAELGAMEPALPSLEDFAAGAGLEDFSHAEQLAAWRATFGTASQRQTRRARLIAKQLEALKALEDVAVQPPQSSDPLAVWLHPDLANKLEAAGLFTLRALIESINGKGQHWWRGVRSIGEQKARRIEEWLRTHETSIGLSLGRHVATPPSTLTRSDLHAIVSRATAVVPIDKLIIPHDLDGTTGAFRAPRHLCMIGARNDYEAVLIWVKSRQGLSPTQIVALKKKGGIDPSAPQGPLDWLHYLSNTQRAYLKEVERFLLWAVVEHKKPLSSMSLEDCEAYRVFLADPTPADRWCGKRGGAQKWSCLWRPFAGPLSAAAQRQAIVVLKSFYAFLVDQCYVVGNPWNGVAKPRAPHPKAARGRSLTKAQWAFVLDRLNALEASSANARLAFALRFLYATGLRLQEVIACKLSDFHFVSYPPEDGDTKPVEGYELRVTGKGGKERVIAVPDEAIGELSRYLVSRGLDAQVDAASNAMASLLGRAVDVNERAPWSPYAGKDIDPLAGIAGRTLYDQCKLFFTECARALELMNGKGAARLREASTHWLRHTHASHLLAADVPLDIVQDRLGHVSPATTMIYATSEDRRKMKAMQKMFAKKS